MLPFARRGLCQKDDEEFGPAALPKLKRAAEDLCELLNRGYRQQSAAAFVGNHYLLSERQRVALMRSICSHTEAELRRKKELMPGEISGKRLSIDGFNIIITLEVALCGGPLFRGMDSTFRDLAGLHGTYHPIVQTESAIRLILTKLNNFSPASAVFYFDRPVSNSGRLKSLLLKMATDCSFSVSAEMSDSVDHVLNNGQNVISSDSVILDRCLNWFNLSASIIPELSGAWVLGLSEGG